MVEYDFKLLRGNVMLGICVGTKSDLVPTCTALLSAINAYWRKFLPVSVSLKSAEGCVKCVSPWRHINPTSLPFIYCDIIPKGYLWCQYPRASASIISGIKEQCYTLCPLNNEPICLVALISHAPAACESRGVGIDMPFVQLQDNVLIDQYNHISAVLSATKAI